MTVSGTAIACKLTKVDDAKAATLKVYFTRFPKEDTSGGTLAARREPRPLTSVIDDYATIASTTRAWGSWEGRTEAS